MKTKVCKKCRRELPLDAFYKHRDSRGGFTNICKDCVKKAYYERKAKRQIEESKQQQDRTEWKTPPPEKLAAMNEKEHRAYCEAWCKAHPVDWKKVAGMLVAAMQNVADELQHEEAKAKKYE